MSLVVSPFTSRYALDAWEAVNCFRCSRTWSEDEGYRCPIQLALRCAVPGPIACDVATHMGFMTPVGQRNRDTVWPCREAAQGGTLRGSIG